MKVILLAAGIGQRLQPITDDIPKPMIKIAGKPILEYILEDLLNFGFNDLCIVVGHEANQIKNYFSNWNKNSCSISFVTQNEYKGTAHAMYLAKDFVKNDPFLLYLADTIIPLDLNDKLSKMVSDVNSMSILSSKSFVNDSNSVGNVVVKDNFVKSISEKSESGETDLAWAGLAFFNDCSIFRVIEGLSPSKHGEYDITNAMDLVIKQNQIIRNYSCEKFIDCGTPKGLLDGLKFILRKKELPATSPSSCNIIEPCYIGINCTFDTNITIGPFVSLGDNVSIGNNVKINETVVLNNTKISSNNIISHSIISEQAKLSVD
jgi:glucose-1-phosphate thymidylyltransferase